MSRILFEKAGNGIWISHLDLMRVFQRAFRRAGLPLKHTQGFNPHAFVSIVLPLPVGTASRCELLDFELDPPETDLAALPDRLNRALPEGIHCLAAYDGGRKIRELCLLHTGITLEYDAGVPGGAPERIAALLNGSSVVVEKKSKNGPVETDIRPMIRSLAVSQPDGNTVVLDAVVCAQNPTLNPMLLPAAVALYLSADTPSFSSCRRLEVLDDSGQIFR